MNDIIKRIDKSKHVVVISHINPDADSLGSASAFYTHLLRLHKKVSFFCATKEIDKNLSFIPWFDKIRDSFPASADLAISLDCGSEDRLGTKLECDLINIDHHKSNTGYGQYSIVKSDCISTTHVLYDFFKENQISINSKMATALYSGVLDDSDGFMSDEVDGTIFALVKELIDIGAEYKLCNRFIKKYHSLAAFRLKAIMISNMSLLNSARVALFLVRAQDMKKSGAVGKDCEAALEESLFLPTVEVAILLKENRDLTLKGSLRSNGKLDVSNIALKFNGGGHKTRAGFNVGSDNTIEDLAKEILILVNEEI